MAKDHGESLTCKAITRIQGLGDPRGVGKGKKFLLTDKRSFLMLATLVRWKKQRTRKVLKSRGGCLSLRTD